jgi:oligoribonuclease
MYICSIDIETTGLNPETSDIVEFGAVMDGCNGSSIDALPVFHAYILPPTTANLYRGEPYALSMHSTIFKRIATKEVGYTYLHPIDLPFQFDQWLSKVLPKQKKHLTLAGKNVGSFDIQFLKRLNGWTDLKLSHRYMDVGPLFFDPTKDEVIPDLNTCLKRCNITETVNHTALDDAKQVLKVLRHYYKL